MNHLDQRFFLQRYPGYLSQSQTTSELEIRFLMNLSITLVYPVNSVVLALHPAKPRVLTIKPFFLRYVSTLLGWSVRLPSSAWLVWLGSNIPTYSSFLNQWSLLPFLVGHYHIQLLSFFSFDLFRLVTIKFRRLE